MSPRVSIGSHRCRNHLFLRIRCQTRIAANGSLVPSDEICSINIRSRHTPRARRGLARLALRARTRIDRLKIGRPPPPLEQSFLKCDRWPQKTMGIVVIGADSAGLPRDCQGEEVVESLLLDRDGVEEPQ
jgi:hypothetical protein